MKEACEAHGAVRGDAINVGEYEPLVPFVICHADYTPIYQRDRTSGDGVVYCVACKATYRRETIQKTTVRCTVCQLTKIK
jgi:hypothetical protein